MNRLVEGRMQDLQPRNHFSTAATRDKSCVIVQLVWTESTIEAGRIVKLGHASTTRSVRRSPFSGLKVLCSTSATATPLHCDYAITLGRSKAANEEAGERASLRHYAASPIGRRSAQRPPTNTRTSCGGTLLETSRPWVRIIWKRMTTHDGETSSGAVLSIVGQGGGTSTVASGVFAVANGSIPAASRQDYGELCRRHWWRPRI